MVRVRQILNSVFAMTVSVKMESPRRMLIFQDCIPL